MHNALFSGLRKWNHCTVHHRSLTLLFFYTCIPFCYKMKGQSLRCCTNCFLVNYTIIIQVTKSCAYPLNKQLHAPSSALYQKFITFLVLLSFCFFGEVLLDCCDGYNRMLAFFVLLCTYIGANAYCHLIGRDDENVLSSCIDQSDDTIHLLRYMHKKQQSIRLYPSQQSNHTSFKNELTMKPWILIKADRTFNCIFKAYTHILVSWLTTVRLALNKFEQQRSDRPSLL